MGDIPQIYTMYNAGVEHAENGVRQHKLPLEAFRQKRQEVVQEVLRARTRHWDNVITATEDTMRQLEMVCTVAMAVRKRVRKQRNDVMSWSLSLLGIPGLVAGKILHDKWPGNRSLQGGFWSAFALLGFGVTRFVFEYMRQYEKFQVSELDSYFEEAYAWYFIHIDAEDFRNRWATVRPRVANILKAASAVASLPFIGDWEIRRIEECLEKDVWYLRLLAKLLRGVEASG
ncbi:unnamed protein product [Effrenium voratum]|nr:unnamed protein product [Effrenium voratum]